jgi:hypothetical protein
VFIDEDGLGQGKKGSMKNENSYPWTEFLEIPICKGMEDRYLK